MGTIITKPYAVQTFSTLIERWKKHPPFEPPIFHMERWYMDSFLYYLRPLSIKDHIDLAPVINRQIQDAWEMTFKKICKVLDKHLVDGTAIFELMCERKFILRRDRSAYNRKVPGKSPKGLKREEWEDYNHWLLAQAFWDGFVASQQPGFTITLPSEVERDIGVLLSDEYKPLWGIQAAFLAVRKPNIGASGEDIKVSPELSWMTYKKETEKANREMCIL